MLVNKKYHKVGNKYWFTATNGYGNEIIVFQTKEQYDENTQQGEG